MVIRLVAESTGLAYFPGLAQPVTIDCNDLPQAEAEEIQRLIDESRFFELPTASRTANRTLPDMWRYCLTIEDDGRCHTIRLTDPTGDPTLQALLDVVRAEAQAVRETRRQSD